MQQRGRHSGRDQLIALIESAASASASQMLVEEQLSDAALLCQPEALTFVPPKDWQSSPDASKLTLHVTEHRVNVADPLQRCAMPFAEYTITVWSGSVSWCVRRRFSDFATLNLDVATAGIPPLKDAPFGGLLSVHPFFQRRHADALEAWLHAVCRSSPEALRTLSLATFLEIDRFHPACAPRLLREARWGRRPPSPTEVTVLNYNMAPARPRRFNAHRRRILCLHGWGEDMDVFRAQTSQLRVALPHFDFFFIQAPSTSEALSGLPLSELAAPVYSKWCEADAADTVSDISSSITSVPSTPAQRGSMPSIGADRADPASVPSKSKGCPAAAAERDALDGVERCADVVREMVLANGPFDAVLGVAQGGVLVALLSALQRGFAPPKPFGLPELPCLWKAAVLVSGWAPASERLASLFNPRLSLPSLHVIASATTAQDGGASPARSAALATPTAGASGGQMLVGCFAKPQVFMASAEEEELLHDPATYQQIAAWLQSVVG